MLKVWIRLGQHSVGSDLGLCLQRLTADIKIFHWQAKTIMKKYKFGSGLKEKRLEKVDF